MQDGSYLQELLTYEMAAAVGLPACRCAHVLVELDGRKVGLYVLKVVQLVRLRWLGGLGATPKDLAAAAEDPNPLLRKLAMDHLRRYAL